jgi:two-component system sensor histidine kinase HydH
MKKIGKTYLWVGTSPWIILGSVLILVPIFVFITIEALNRQKENATRMLREKGAALIRSFEAGTRIGFLGMYGGSFQIQRLLMETAQQPDIVHLVVVDLKGVILAHNDLDRIGKRYGTDLDLEAISRLNQVSWRQVVGEDGTLIFEVFRKFSPTGPPTHRRRGMLDGDRGLPPIPFDPVPHAADKLIFVGLDLAPVEAARKEDARHTLIMAVTLLVTGFAGMVCLFLAQAYRSTKISLSRVQAFSDNLVKNMPIGLLAVDTQGRIASFNQAAEEIFGAPFADVAGKGVDAALPRTLALLIEELQRERRFIDREIACSRADGTQIPLEVIATALEGDDGAHLGFVVLCRDLSEIRRLEDEVARSRRLASIGRLAAGVAHEIRNPLSSIKGFATYFKQRYRDVPEDQKTAGIMIQEVERLNRVIGELLEFARPLTLQRKPVSMKGLIDHSWRLVKGDLDRQGIRMEVDLPGELKDVLVDPDRMNQVLLNLYLNAIEAMKEGGTLIVRVSQPAGTRDTTITVADTGRGIPEKDLGHVFDPYFTTKPSGTGLGLAIVHKIIETHGGEIRVDSGPGRGTSVTLHFPDSVEG